MRACRVLSSGHTPVDNHPERHWCSQICPAKSLKCMLPYLLPKREQYLQALLRALLLLRERRVVARRQRLLQRLRAVRHLRVGAAPVGRADRGSGPASNQKIYHHL